MCWKWTLHGRFHGRTWGLQLSALGPVRFLRVADATFVWFYAWETYQILSTYVLNFWTAFPTTNIWTVLPVFFLNQNLQGMWKSRLPGLLRFGFVVFKRGSFGSSNSDLGVSVGPVSSGRSEGDAWSRGTWNRGGVMSVQSVHFKSKDERYSWYHHIVGFVKMIYW